MDRKSYLVKNMRKLAHSKNASPASTALTSHTPNPYTIN